MSKEKELCQFCGKELEEETDSVFCCSECYSKSEMLEDMLFGD